MRRVVFSPRWLALHALMIVLVGAFVALGVWQWQRAEDGNTRSIAYAVQWPLFAAFVVFMWAQLLRDGLRPDRAHTHPRPAGPAPENRPPPDPPPVKHRWVVADSADTQADPELAAYNRYLADLHARHERTTRS